MTTLRLNVLRPEALSLYHVLASAKEMVGMTLMGGTGLALQIGHRISLDFDFATFEKTLPMQRIDALVSCLKEEGHTCKLITDSTSVSQFKINTGENLLHYVRDYAVNGVKVTFFAHGRTQSQRDFFKQAKKIFVEGQSFGLLSLDAMKIAKTLVLADRVRSRDLFDLMILMQDYEFSIEQQMDIVKSLGHVDDTEFYKAVLTGIIPIDKEDEGLLAVNVNVMLEDMYAYFNNAVADYEIKMAEQYFSESD